MDDHVSTDAAQLLREAIRCAEGLLRLGDPVGAGAVLRGFVLSPTYKEMITEDDAQRFRGVKCFMPENIADTLRILSAIPLDPPKRLAPHTHEVPRSMDEKRTESRMAAFQNLARRRDAA